MSARRQVAPAGEQLLAHGYTLTDLHQATKLAVNTARGWFGLDYTDLMEAAWFGIVEQLYTAHEFPGWNTLIRAGQAAVNALIADEKHTRGVFKYKSAGAGYRETGSMPAFARFWFNHHPRSPEEPIVERVAVMQIFAKLKLQHREALMALAVHEDYQAAAAALGVGYPTFKSTLMRARREFYALWHEGEIPSQPWGCDRRVASYARQRTEELTAGARQEEQLERLAERDMKRSMQEFRRRRRGRERIKARDLVELLLADEAADA